MHYTFLFLISKPPKIDGPITKDHMNTFKGWIHWGNWEGKIPQLLVFI